VENFVDDLLEFTVRELAFEDRARLQLPLEQQGVIVQNLINAGWAALAGLHNDDILREAAGHPLRNVTDFRNARDAALKGTAARWLLRVERNAQTFYVEVDLKPLKS
jgi:S1-C subfamily serine protease